MNQSESRVETRFEAILPTLVTKSDVAEVRVEIANVRAEMSKQYADHTKWLMGLFVMMVIGFGGIWIRVTDAAVLATLSGQRTPVRNTDDTRS
jgi:hypothetical protein